ncbi:GDP-mannose 4,6-dehydratase [Mycobacterium sp. AMU20-3851]|uniref:GDP-mannose 4,6-dehydratase n=1 Tax=Mycobacterium sp. AMU20-3851 TaxID=3122055 RepID=UPI003754DE43
MRALVTGAAGFIGSTLVDRLLNEGHQVVALDNLSTGVLGNLDEARRKHRLQRDRFTFVQTDIQAPELSDIMAGAKPDVVFHLAAQVNLRASITDPKFDAQTNVLGTINVLEAVRHSGVRRIVYAASGGSRYGTPDSLPADETLRVDPISPYAVAKLAGEMYLRAYAEMYGIWPICLALANVYGPRQNPRGEAGVITVFGTAMITNRTATIFGNGSAARDYVYVDDVVEAFMRAAHTPDGTVGTFNIGTGRQATVLDVHRQIAQILGSSTPPLFEQARSGELQAIALDASKALVELGWAPSVDLPDGIGRTIQWLRTTLETDPAELIGA